MTLSLCVLLLAGQPPALPGPEDYERVMTRHTRLRYRGDLDEIKRRGVLRVLTRNNSSSYFITKGRELGFQYEMAKAFADELGVRLAMVVPSSRAGLIPALLKGEGDVIAAGMSATESRAKLVRFTGALFEGQRVLVTHRDIIKPLDTVADLPAFTLHVVRRSTTYRQAVELGKRLGAPLRIESVPADVEMEEIIRRVRSGQYEATIVDRNVLELEQAIGADVVARLDIGRPLPKVWAVRPSAPRLAEAASAFIDRARSRKLIRVLLSKYFRPGSRGARSAQKLEFRADSDGRISPFDAVFRAEGERLGIDWRLLAAVAYGESRFNPRAESRFGALGLMQVLPSTGRRYGSLTGDDRTVARKLLDPAINVRVGAIYLAWLMKLFAEDGVAPRQTIRFALAAYNVGLGHVMDARELAVRTGKDRNRWFGNVERSIMLKKDPRWHVKTRFGFCRADQPVAYVSRIQSRYDVYVRHVTL